MTQTKELEIDIVHHLDGCSILHVYGDLNERTSPELRAAIRDLIARPAQERVIVDFEGTTHLSSSDVYGLVDPSTAPKNTGVRLIFSGLRGFPQHALALTRLDSLFEISDTVDQALP